MLLLLKEIVVSEKKAVLFSSHDLELVMRFADVIWVLDDDRAFFSETREGILKSGALKNAFGGKYLEFLTKKKAENQQSRKQQKGSEPDEKRRHASSV